MGVQTRLCCFQVYVFLIFSAAVTSLTFLLAVPVQNDSWCDVIAPPPTASYKEQYLVPRIEIILGRLMF